jgi:hypothetical protein
MATATMRDPCQSRHMIKTYVNWCMECEKELCHECTKYHPALKTMKNHHVVDLKLKTHIHHSCKSIASIANSIQIVSIHV